MLKHKEKENNTIELNKDKCECIKYNIYFFSKKKINIKYINHKFIEKTE